MPPAAALLDATIAATVALNMLLEPVCCTLMSNGKVRPVIESRGVGNSAFFAPHAANLPELSVNTSPLPSRVPCCSADGPITLRLLHSLKMHKLALSLNPSRPALLIVCCIVLVWQYKHTTQHQATSYIRTETSTKKTLVEHCKINNNDLPGWRAYKGSIARRLKKPCGYGTLVTSS